VRPGGSASAIVRAVSEKGAVRRHVLAGLAGVAAGAVLGGGALGLVAGGGVAVAAHRLLGRADPDGEADRRRGLARELPVACDLLAVCLSGGVPVAGALAAVAASTQEPLAGELRTVAALYRWGAAPSRAWADPAPEFAALGRILVRAGESGSSVVPSLRALAADARAAARARTDAAVRRAGVWVLAPLGACFLPAFVCLGVAPLVLGIAGHVFR
jgi:Flp pilus assembly protein TadB